jgi:hypothetical protein
MKTYAKINVKIEFKAIDHLRRRFRGKGNLVHTNHNGTISMSQIT